jgi:SagB-type dehydrogenase family enzyme
MKLIQPRRDGPLSLEKVIQERRSIRDYRHDAVHLADLAQLLWAAQGITGPTDGHRAAPSAGALYPLEVYVVAGNVTGLEPGVYKYEPQGHALTELRAGDVRNELYQAALRQECVRDAAVVVVLSAVYQRTSMKYGQRTERYVYVEIGHAAENLLLQAVSLGLGSVPVGAFDDALVKEVLRLPEKEAPLYLLPVGKP